MIKYLLSIAMSLLIVSPISSYAGTSNGTFKSSATLSGMCSVSVGAMSFGSITPGGSSSTATNSVTVQCTKSTPYKYYIGNQYWGNGCPVLLGATNGDKIPYGIKDLQTGSYTANSNSGTGDTSANALVAGTGTGTIQILNFEGVIQAPYRDSHNTTFSASEGCSVNDSAYKSPGVNFNPYVSPDSYTDTLVFGVIY